MNTFQEITNLRKQGQLQEAYTRATEALENDSEDLWARRAMGWVLYDLIKRELQNVDDDNAQGTQLGNGSVDFLLLNRYFEQFESLDLPIVDGMIRSCILRQAVKAQSAGWNRFLDFVEWWNIEHFTEEDRKPGQTPDGKPYPSLELSTLYALGREAKKLDRGDKRLQWVQGLLENGLQRYGDDIWLSRSVALIEAKLGNKEQARARLLLTLRRKPREWWLWKEMAELLEASDVEAAINCYYHACSLLRDKDKLVGVYQDLAQLLCQTGRFEEAAWFVTQAVETRARNNWSIPLELHKLRTSDWYTSQTEVVQPKVSTEVFARMFIHDISPDDIQKRLAIVDRHNTDKKLAYLIWGARDGAVAKYQDFRILQKAPVGNMLEIETVETNGRTQILSCTPVPFQTIEEFAIKIEGRLARQQDKAHGFVVTDNGQRYFVPPHVVRDMSDGTRVSAVCVNKYNPKQDKVSWVVVQIQQA